MQSLFSVNQLNRIEKTLSIATRSTNNPQKLHIYWRAVTRLQSYYVGGTKEDKKYALNMAISRNTPWNKQFPKCGCRNWYHYSN